MIGRLVECVERLGLAMVKSTEARKTTSIPDVSRLEPPGTIRAFEPEASCGGCDELG